MFSQKGFASLPFRENLVKTSSLTLLFNTLKMYLFKGGTVKKRRYLPGSRFCCTFIAESI